jgi:hypothetical protein
MESIANIVKTIEGKVQEINELTAALAVEMKKIPTVEKKKRSSKENDEPKAKKPRTKKVKGEKKEDIKEEEEVEEGEED